jgi:hypothetical protein
MLSLVKLLTKPYFSFVVFVLYAADRLKYLFLLEVGGAGRLDTYLSPSV